MILREYEKSRPEGNGTAQADHQVAGSPLTLPVTTDETLIDRADAYVVFVEDRAGRMRRRVYMAVASAENAVRRAHNRGADAQIVLARLIPIRSEDDA